MEVKKGNCLAVAATEPRFRGESEANGCSTSVENIRGLEEKGRLFFLYFHLHFVDGSDGGYALAAQELKRRLSEIREISKLEHQHSREA